MPKRPTRYFRRGALGFSVLRFWTFFRSVFRFLCQKTSVFRFWCSMRFADFLFFSIWFSVFVKNTSSFSVLVPNVVFGFSYFIFPIWTYFGIQFCMRFSVLADFVCGFAVLDDFSSVLRFLVYPNAHAFSQCQHFIYLFIFYQDVVELFWTDSQVVIGYINDEARRFHTLWPTVYRRYTTVPSLTNDTMLELIQTQLMLLHVASQPINWYTVHVG